MTRSCPPSRLVKYGSHNTISRGDLSQGGFDYTYWSAALTLGFNANPPLELEIRDLDTLDMNGFTCPPSGVFACNNLFVGSLKATF